MPRATPPTAAAALAPAPRNLFVGTSGWAYPTWKPDFYPTNVPARGFLHYYAAHLTSVEVNYTFRTLPTTAQLQGWLDATPPGFRFSFKAPQRITHFQRLRDSATTVADFVTSLQPAADAGKLGPLLFQLPPNFAADPARLASFLALPAHRGHQLAFEFRHPTWFSEETYTILRAHNVALCIAPTSDQPDDLLTPTVSTADFHCYRLRRNGGYTPAELKTLATTFTTLAQTQQVYVYLKHEDEPTGALNALALLAAANPSGAR